MAETTSPGGSGGGGVTPLQIYQALTGAGYSTIQAVGIMANMLAESSLNPEAAAKDTNGYYSYGLVQWNTASYPKASSLVTGNPVADLAAQVKYLGQTVKPAALAGATGAAVAGNFAANFERCQTCQPGGASYNQRVANAATIMTMATTGAWPLSVGTPTDSGNTQNNSNSTQNQSNDTQAQDVSAGPNSTCLVGFSNSGVDPSIFGWHPVGSVGAFSVCVISKSQARALIGGGLLIFAGFVVVVGIWMIYKSTSIPQTVNQLVQAAPRQILSIFNPPGGGGDEDEEVGEGDALPIEDIAAAGA